MPRGFSHRYQNLVERVLPIYIQALDIAPHDPFVLHELGVTAFQSGQYEVAEKYLRDALLKVESVCKGGGEEMVRSSEMFTFEIPTFSESFPIR